MTAKEAYKKVTTEHPMWDLVACVECQSVFIFKWIPIGYDKPLDRLLDNTVSIDKKTGVIRSFKPSDLPSGEFRAGKTITNFKEK